MTCAHAIARLIDLRDRLSRDAERDGHELRRRDRAIGRELRSLADHPHAQVFAWLDRVDGGDDSPGRRAARTVRLGAAMLAIAGLIIGCAAAAGLLYYDGSHPVNIVHALVVFVGAQLLLLALLVVGLVKHSGSLAGFSPALTHAVLRVLPSSRRQALEQFIGAAQANRRVYGRVYKWFVLLWTQTFGVAFNVGALATVVYMVVFTDIAFAWSTTLDIDAATFHRVTSALATPWAAWLGDANPDAAFIATTRYFRLHDGTFPAAHHELVTFGGWWPFLVAAMVCYGLLPRTLTWLIARWRLGAAVRHAVLRTPGVEQLRDRLNHAHVITRGDDQQPATSPNAVAQASPPPVGQGGMALAINWSAVDIADDQLSACLRLSLERILHAGGAHTLAQDAQVIEQASGARRVVIAVRAFEPPMGEFIDFVRELRRVIGDGKTIEVVPVDATPRQLDVWRSKLATVGDPWLSVREAA
jgi:hypothetical protein